jgi:hypothetical protein
VGEEGNTLSTFHLATLIVILTYGMKIWHSFNTTTIDLNITLWIEAPLNYAYGIKITLLT